MTEAIRVGFIIGQLHRGGTERQLYELATRLTGGPCSPYVYCFSQVLEPYGPMLTAAGVPLRFIPRRRRMELRRVRALARLFRQDHLDLVHSLSFHANLYAYLALRGRPGRLIASNRYYVPGGAGPVSWINGLALRRSARVVVNSETGKAFTAEHFRVPPERIKVIPNGVDAARFTPPLFPAAIRPELGIPPGAPLVGLIGRITAQKRVDIFLEAARRVSEKLPGARFLIVGKGELMEAMRRKTSQLGLDDLAIFTGGRDDVPDLLAALDLLVLCSDDEGLPNVILEAMAARKPVVATDVGACRELVAEGVTGHLVARRDSEALAAAILRVLLLPDRGRAIGEAGHRRAVGEFGVDAMAAKFRDLFQEVHAQAARRSPG
ncbi:MAG TPA: GT4 family glycosyltransferase PelF [Candidatus Polarisedimenticolia bacterium]|jgi:glycosyltransferase involved in cell wall biosynthesis|nr:GT4 family glycosyltransferase PelF [Candidatus Polarisedimenticolia bacterium]